MITLSTKKLMIAGGCSFTENYIHRANETKPKLWYDGKRHDWQYIQPFPVWPEIVADSQNLSLTNTAHAGSGNDAIFHKVLEQVLQHKNKISLVVVMWSSGLRRDVQTASKWRSSTAVETHQSKNIELFKTMFNIGSLNYTVCINYFYRYSLTLQEVCRLHNIKLIQCQGVSLIKPLQWMPEYAQLLHTKELDEKLNKQYLSIKIKDAIKYFIDHPSFDQLEKYNTFIDWPLFMEIGGQCFQDIIRENKEEYMLHRNDAHPNAKAHKFYADKILDKIHE